MTQKKYIWQAASWPNFSYRKPDLQPLLDKALTLQAELVGQGNMVPGEQDREAEMDALIQSALQTSLIEGETLNLGSVRSSVAKQLGLDQAGVVYSPQTSTQQTESLVAMLCDATSDLNSNITLSQLCRWQAALFTDPSIHKTTIVGALRGETRMQVVSQNRGREIVHFEAPPKEKLDDELAKFIAWFNGFSGEPRNKKQKENGLVRAALAHLWFITLHPFDDGNGRVARALTDRALAQVEQTSVRFYSLSASIEANRNEYYNILEQTQAGKSRVEKVLSNKQNVMDVSAWVAWFLEVFIDALEEGLARIGRVKNKARFWQLHRQTVLTERQVKVLNRLLDSSGKEFTEGIAARHYQGIAGVSKATATRDLTELLAKSCLRQLAGAGRSARYIVDLGSGAE